MSAGVAQLAHYIWTASVDSPIYGPAKKLIKMVVSYDLGDDPTGVEIAAHEARLGLVAKYIKENVLENFGLDTEVNAWFLTGVLWQMADTEDRR